MASKEKHLDYLQAVISRMASNSFLIKGWSITISSALIALAVKQTLDIFLYLTLLPATLFWLLDGYFLSQERLFRKLYNEIRLRKDEEIDYSMDTSAHSKGVTDWLQGMFSRTLLVFYLTFYLLVIIAIIFLKSV